MRGVGARPWRIALLADFHVGGHAEDVDRLKRIVLQTNSLQPDVTLLLGDYMNMMPFGGGRVPPETVAEILAELRAPSGVAGVLGNHDWEYGYEPVSSALSAAGIAVIDNRLLTVERGDERLAIVGLQDDIHGSPDLDLFQAVEPGLPVIVATHDPGVFHDIPPGWLMVAGHTHGGQVRWSRLPAPINPSRRAPRSWGHGLVKERDATLVVSAGLGVSGLPLRIGVPPEIVLVTLCEPLQGPGR
jgi:predicted MPP superfamily phosphohydrolase